MLHFDVLGLKTIRNSGGVAVPWWFITRQGVISIYEAGKLLIAREAVFQHSGASLNYRSDGDAAMELSRGFG